MGPPAGVAAAAKEAIDAAEASGPVPDLREEARAHAKVYPSPDAVVDRLRVVMDHGGQQRLAELDLEGVLRSIPCRMLAEIDNRAITHGFQGPG